ncbi:D-alanyl-D-alanine carboxypeptidase [Streptomyces sp. NPDC057336]|uniref:D-alanyl-D-alanine carboxypeptidase n=1 Tax=Streptomyces sp. NPDC057336 TaxID=3346102 RepID=UPI0036251610
MEEASVAGESPDRSKQHGSSEEPTSGSAGPVPEARTGASETRDPRLSVAREAGKPSASAGSGESRGGVDTATRVLSVRDTQDDGAASTGGGSPEEAGDSGTSGSAGSSTASGDSDATEDEPAGPAAASDGRLRDAVAAWVATAEERAAANARHGDAEGDDEDTPGAGAAGDVRADADEAPDESGRTAADADATRDTGALTTAGQATDGETPAGERAASDADGEPGDGETPADGAEPDGDGEAAGKAAGGDQPTAVFKALRPSAREVDQPTTMLKLGGSAESDAERTSKFVALRQPDDPATRKPPQNAPQAPRTGTTTAVPHVGPERTTQQPLPPKPPLDLLAELTNTPPPPETPLRTTVRRVKIWTPLVLLLVVILGVVQSMRPLPAPELDLTAQESFTFEGGKPEIPWPSSGQAALDVQGIGTFGSSGDQKPVPIASVAKVMTAYVILRDHPLKSGADGPMIEIDQAAEDQSDAGDESTVQVYAGDKISQREALDAILIASANNVARLLARWDAGSEKAFVEKMNAAAKDLGMTNTTYTDPSGLNNTTVSTAVDQVKLAKAAMESVAFREVAQKMSYNDYKGVNHSNWNQLVGYNGVVGIKTGTTTSALGNLVFAAKKEVGGETRTIVGAVVRQPATADKGILAAALDSSDKLIRAAQDVLESSTILKKGGVVGYVDDGLGGRTPVVATEDVRAVGWPGLTVKLTFEADEVPHTAAAGTKVGTLTVGDGDAAGAVKVPVALQKDLVEPAFTDKLTRLG